MIETISGMRKDFVASYLRSQINRLSDILTSIEIENRLEDNYADENLKQVEINLRQLRKLCVRFN